MKPNHATQPAEAAVTPPDRRDSERKQLRRRLARLIADREAAKQTASRTIRET